MDCERLILNTDDGLTFGFSKNEEGKPTVYWYNSDKYFEYKLVEGSVSELKVGEFLKFRYYVGLFDNMKEFVSETPIASIQEIHKD